LISRNKEIVGTCFVDITPQKNVLDFSRNKETVGTLLVPRFIDITKKNML
jgi:hypothetical protein